MRCAAVLWGAILMAGCGARTLPGAPDASVDTSPVAAEEVCNRLDDDLDDDVDEDFRDAAGRYVDPDHCGGCDQPCEPPDHAVGVMCGVLEGGPACMATSCEPGFGRTAQGRCTAIDTYLCAPCTDDGDCGGLTGARCTQLVDDQRCTIGCETGCPDGYMCEEGRCLPEGGSCNCETGRSFDLACALRDPDGARCVGRARCDDGTLSECHAPAETCDALDNDCDGEVDEGFLDPRGAYSLDDHHCGGCGIDCTTQSLAEGELTCGGDPFAPSCVFACPDIEDGLDPGDRVDGDYDIATGCECVVGAVEDAPGPVDARGEALDVNCDGADGDVLQSIYVALDGDDDNPGSPTRPLRTLNAAFARARQSMATAEPRPHVFVASGVYTESLRLPDGVQVHGGYRSDFRALDPDGFRTEIRAPGGGALSGGVALRGDEVGRESTVLQWLTLQGSNPADGASAVGLWLRDPGPRLTLDRIEVRTGRPAHGEAGQEGAAGRSGSEDPAGDGEPPRRAVEGDMRQCLETETNRVQGGQPGRNRCDGVDVHGGRGGSPGCPSFPASSSVAHVQPPGEPGRSALGRAGGDGGEGGVDVRGPIQGAACEQDVCCGLADFTVPFDFHFAQAGRPGSDGDAGASGRGCQDPLDAAFAPSTMASMPAAGSAGRPGTGGGGGGAGGGAQIDWVNGVCEWVDGLGGAGGGGGAGGCGGAGGRPGGNGGSAVGILVEGASRPDESPTFRQVRVVTADAARGGPGGAGGDGGLGGAGGFGGALAREQRSIPPLAGPSPGARGGKGGNGGSGGGGGGGCGGSSVGIWIRAADPGAAAPLADAWRQATVFELGQAGPGGSGGGGAVPGEPGSDGARHDVVVR